MEPKKKPNADLRNKYGLFMSIGMVLSILIVTVIFEWGFYVDRSPKDLGEVEYEYKDYVFEEMEIPPTYQSSPPPPSDQMPDIIEVPDIEEIEIDLEITEETKVDRNGI